MKKVIICLCVCISFLLGGCKGNILEQSTEENSLAVESTIYEDDGLTEVIFANRIPNTCREELVLTRNTIDFSLYDVGDEDDLYAFFVLAYNGYENACWETIPDDNKGIPINDNVKLIHRFNANSVAEEMRNAGLTVIENYPYCCFTSDYLKVRDLDNKLVVGFCAVVGTMEQFQELFDNKEPINGLYFELCPAPRPDILDFIEESGWNDEKNYEPLDWYYDNAKTINKELGEEEQIALRIDLSKETNPETMASTNIEYAVEMHDVVFANQFPENWQPTSPEDSAQNKEWTTNILEEYYTVQENPNTLYAFRISETMGLGNPILARTNALARKVRTMGLMLVENYPYCYYQNDHLIENVLDGEMACGYCTVVGTMEELQQLFDETDSLGGILYDIRPAPRPDIMDADLTDEKQVTINVPLIMPYY